MTVSLHVPYLEYDKIRPIAESFLREYGAWGTFPVDIEYIIDVQMGIDIIPLPGLLRDLTLMPSFLAIA